MQGSLQRLVEMFSGGDKCLVVPVYQRNYDWKLEHCSRLFDDLVEMIRERRDTHFFGAIVYKDEDGDMIGESIIIDGQQRLTTVNLLFLALFHGLRDGNISGSSNLASRIHGEYLHSEFAASGYKLKLKPVKADASAYSKLFGEPKYFDETSNVTANYTYFADRLARRELTGDEVFDAIRRLQIMKLKLERDDDAQLIFESLNSTGLDLSEADMIRNFVLMGENRPQQEYLYENFWNRMEISCDYDTSRFIRHYLTSKLGRIPNMKRLYEDFKSYIKQGQREVPDVLSDMRDYAVHYRDLRQARTDNESVDRLLRRYNLIDREVTVPLLLPVMAEWRAETITVTDLLAIIRTVDNYLTRRFICGYPTNALNKIFALLYRETAKLRGPDNAFNDVLVHLLLQRQGSGTFPNNQDFAGSLKTRDLYRISTAQRTYFLESLENGVSNDVRDIAHRLSKGEISVEHIMPQTLTSEWQSDLGPDYERIHETWVHRLGNLTVTGYNSSYSNNSFVSKRDRIKGFGDSPYRLNSDVKDAEVWGEDEMERRTNRLVNEALLYWPTPQTSYVPKPELRDVEAMGEDNDFTGRKIHAWEFGGLTYAVASWKQMIIEVVRLLTEMDSAGTHRRALGSWMKYRPNHVTPVEEGYSEVVPGIDVFTSSSTESKMWLLRDLFHNLGIDTDELVFHLTPELRDGSTK